MASSILPAPDWLVVSPFPRVHPPEQGSGREREQGGGRGAGQRQEKQSTWEVCGVARLLGAHTPCKPCPEARLGQGARVAFSAADRRSFLANLPTAGASTRQASRATKRAAAVERRRPQVRAGALGVPCATHRRRRSARLGGWPVWARTPETHRGCTELAAHVYVCLAVPMAPATGREGPRRGSARPGAAAKCVGWCVNVPPSGGRSRHWPCSRVAVTGRWRRRAPVHSWAYGIAGSAGSGAQVWWSPTGGGAGGCGAG